MPRLLSVRAAALPTFAARESAYARSLKVVSLALPLGTNGYDAVTRVFGTRINTGGTIVTGRWGRALRCTGAANGGGFSLPIAGVVSAGATPGYSVVLLAASTGTGENGLGRIAAFAGGFNWYPFGSGSYTWSGVWTGGSNLTYDLSTVWPHDGVARCLGISYMPGTNTATPTPPTIMLDGKSLNKTQTEWPSGSFAGLTGPLYVGNASNNARCFQGDVFMVAVFARALTWTELANITREPSILFSA